MKNWLKKIFPAFLAAALCASLSVPALAADTAQLISAPTAPPAGISVELDGKSVLFPDAVPEVVNERTFLPFRAIFEAMGATVDYDAAGQTVIAARGGATLRMPIGATEATLTAADGTVTALTMDVAAYAKDNRTFVPVRFAAQAFGCNVGWDQQNQTVLILDVEKLLAETFDAGKFSLYSKYMEYSGKFSAGNWAVTGDFAMNMSMTPATDAITAAGSLSGVISGSSAADLAMKLDMDMTGLMTAMAETYDMPLDEMGVTAADLKQSFEMELRFSLESGKYYMLIKGMPAEAGMPENTWLCMDLNAFMAMAGAGMDLPALLKASTATDLRPLMRLALANAPLVHKDASYAAVQSAIDLFTGLFSDDSFKKDGQTYVSSHSMDYEGAAAKFAFTLLTDAAGNVVGYDLTCHADALIADATAGLLAEAGTPLAADKISMDISTSVNEKNECSTSASFSFGAALSLDMDMTYSYTATDRKAAAEPPAGAPVVDYFDLLDTK